MDHQMKPAHPGTILREDILKELNLTITDAAKVLQVSRKQLSEILNEVAAISPEMALRIERGFGVEAGFWLDMQKNYDLWRIESSGKVQNVKRFSGTDQPASL